MGAVFVTGAASGIGRTTAIRLAGNGAAIAVFDRDEAAVPAAVEELESLGVRALGHIGDVTDAAAVEEAVARTVADLGDLDGAAACAGIEVTGTVVTATDEAWNRAIAVNLTGVMLTARYTIRAMLESGGGAFVAISSDAGLQGCADWTPYCVSKHGVVGLIRCLALDYGALGVRSNVVCPSLVKTPMADRIFEGTSSEEEAAWRALLPMNRFARPEEVANVVAHLLSDEASYTNGLVYSVDGGETAGLFVNESAE